MLLNEKDVDFLVGRVLNCNLQDSDKKLLASIIQIYQMIQWNLQEAKISIGRLRSLFGFKPREKRCHLDHRQDSSEDVKKTGEALDEKSADPLGALLSQALTSLKEFKTTLEKESKKGHGRLGHESYPGAKIIKQPHESLKAGDLCPEECGGRLYSLESKTTVCLTGHALASATKYLLERLRCAVPRDLNFTPFMAS